MSQPLDYASPQIDDGGRLRFRVGLTLFAIAGVLANLAFIALAVTQLHRSLWGYHDLMQNPRAYGREIAPAMVASLRDVRMLWLAFWTFCAAAAYGLMLAVNLFVAAIKLGHGDDSDSRRLRRYRRWKPVALVLMLIALFWLDDVHSQYWSRATRHTPVGSGPPFVFAALLAFSALLPWWWVGRRSSSKSERVAGNP